MLEHQSRKKEDLSQDDVSKLTKAMKDDEFKKYMDEYCRETSDPKNRAEYLAYLAQLESKGEMPEGQALLRTKPGCVIKTNILFKSGQTQKCFINIVHSDQMDDLKEDDDPKTKGKRVHLPYSLSPPRADRDLKDEYCMTCDMAVSSWTFYQAMQRPQILKMFVDTAAEGLGSKFLQGFEDVKKDYKVLRRLQCKGGQPMPMSVAKNMLKKQGRDLPIPEPCTDDAMTPSELKQMRAEVTDKKKKAQEDEEAEILAKQQAIERKKFKDSQPVKVADRIRVPQYALVHSGLINMTDFMQSDHQPKDVVCTVPKTLKLVVELPTVKKVSDVNLEVTAFNVVIDVAEKYYLDLPLPYEIEDEKGTAKFDKVKQTLSLEMPVKAKPPDPEMLAFSRRSLMTEEDYDKLDDLVDGREDELDDLVDEKARPAELLTSPKATAPASFSPESESDEAWAQRMHAQSELSQDDVPSVPPSVPAAPKAPPRELLEIGSKGDSMRISGAVEAAVKDVDVVENVVLCEEGEDLPEFIQSDTFTGYRPGYAFKTDIDGLGFYRDYRQTLPKPTKKNSQVKLRHDARDDADDVVVAQAPLVTDITPIAHTSSSAAGFAPSLPSRLRRHVDEKTSLRRRITAADIVNGQIEDLHKDAHVDWHQNTQNVTIFFDVAFDCEVCDVQLSAIERRLIVTYCTRPRNEERWQRHRLRRVLLGEIDERQWHADLIPSSSSSPGQLVVVLRKLDQTHRWSGAFDTAVAVTSTPSAPSQSTATPASAPLALAPGVADAASEAGDIAVEEGTICGDGGGSRSTGVKGLIDVGISEDSSALDAAAPVPLPTSDANGVQTAAVDPNAGAAAALAQSAMIMGQSVILRSRFMYQLL